MFCTFLFPGIFSNYVFSSSPTHATPDVWEVLRNQFTLTHEVTQPDVQEQIRWLVAHPSYLHKVSRQSEPYIYHVVAQIKKRKLPGELALLPMIESAYDPFAYSGVGAAGLWQLMPGTGNELGLKQDWWFDGRRSIGPSTDAALNYLVYLNKFFDGNWILAIAAYDSGEGTIARAIKSSNRSGKAIDFWSLPIPRETKIYVPRLLALAEIMKNPQRYHVALPNIPYLPYFEEVNIGSQIDLNHAAKLAGISYKELIKLNPGYNRWTTAPYKPFKLLIPTEKVERFNLNLAHFPEEKRVNWTKHYVKQGDSLSNIAARYHTTVNLLKQLNQLTSNRLKNDQSILIPSNKNTTTIAKKNEPPRDLLLDSLKQPQNHRMIHIVQAHDSYTTLEKLYGVSKKDIQSWNQLTSNQALSLGKQLIIWKKTHLIGSYTIKSGDNLSRIAQRYQTTISKLLQLNPNLTKNTPLRLRQKIIVG